MSALDWLFHKQEIPHPVEEFKGDIVHPVQPVKPAEPTIRPNELKLPDIPAVASLMDSISDAYKVVEDLDNDIMELELAISKTKEMCIEHLKHLTQHLAEVKLLKEAHELAIKHCKPKGPNTNENVNNDVDIPQFIYKPLESLEPDDLIHLGERGHTSERSIEIPAGEPVEGTAGSQHSSDPKSEVSPETGGHNPDPRVVVSSSGVAPVVYDKV